MTSVPKAFRLHLGIFGRRNAGKSSLLNALTRQKTSIVSDIAGTTTDPVEKTMELLPLGPVLFIDTAGIDDDGVLGKMRVEKTVQVFDRTEIGLLVVDLSRGDPCSVWGTFEQQIADEFKKRNIPVIVVLSRGDLVADPVELKQTLDEKNLPWVVVACPPNQLPSGLGELKDALVRLVPEEFLSPPPIISDLLPVGETAVLVVPIDKEAPKGRLILPQVQTIRDLLDADRYCLVVRENRLADAIERLNRPPKLVVTDSQAFKLVASIVPESIPLTSFSILFARQKGDFKTMVEGAKAIGRLGPRARILIAEACSHHPVAEDIGTEKIPNWLRQSVADTIEIGHVQGHDFPTDVQDLASWDLVIHCGACVWNRREMLSRIAHCLEAGVPITNYGLAIAAMHGILARAVKPICGD